MSEGDAPRPPSHSPPPGAAFQGRGLSCCVAVSNTLPDPDHPDRTPCPPKSSVKRTGLAVASGRTLQTPAPAGEPLFRRRAPARVAGSQPPCRTGQRRWARPLSGHTEAGATGRTREGPVIDGLRRQGRSVSLKPGQGVRRAPPGPGGDCRVQAGSGSRSSRAMRASTALRTSGPALCSMALQSAVLWMVATVRRSIS